MDNAISAIIANSSEKFGRILSAGLNTEGIKTIICGRTHLVNAVEDVQADAVIIENNGCTDIAEIISVCRKTGKTFLIVIGDDRGDLSKQLKNIGCVIPHPVDVKMIIRIIVSAYVKRRGLDGDDLEKYAEKMLCEAGIVPHLLGTCYLAYSVAVSVRGDVPANIYGIHKAAAEKWGKNAASVDRAVRISLRLACDRGNSEFIKELAHGENSGSMKFIEYFSDMLRTRIIRDGAEEVLGTDK